MRLLDEVKAERGLRKVTLTDSGAESCGRLMQSRALDGGEELRFIPQGKPVLNAHIE
jgi:hypothetical protein